MSTVLEIEAALPRLTAGELHRVEMRLRQIRREKGGGVLLDDDYGIWTEEDQVSAAAEAFAVLDGKEPA